MQDSATSGFTKLAERNKVDVLLQLLCNISDSGGGTPATPNRVYYENTTAPVFVTFSTGFQYTGAGVVITPATTGQIKIQVSGSQKPDGLNISSVQLVYGTGAVPAATTVYPDGTNIGPLATNTESDFAIAAYNCFGFYKEIKSLTIGQPYHIALIQRTTNAVYSASLGDIFMQIEEQNPEAP
jgi:hypothetical protein